MQLIPVSYHGKIHCHAMVNDDIAEIVKRHPWSLHYKGYASATISKKSWKMHRFIYFHLFGFLPSKGEEIDHIDRNKMNNLDSNLRRTTRSLNHVNKGLQSNNTSGFKGVRWYKAYGKWAVRLKKDGVEHHCGYFSDKNEAIRVAREAYARLFPSEKSLSTLCRE